MLTCVLVSLVFANETIYEFTLSKSIQKALANNPSIKARQEAIKSARFSMLQARTDLFPKLSTTYEFVYESERSYLWPDFPVSTENNYTWEIIVEQPVFTGFSLINTLKKTHLDLNQKKIALEIRKLDLALEVKQAYFAILKARKNVDVADQILKSTQTHVAIASSFFEAGKIPGHDLLEAEVRCANAQEKLIQAQNTLDSANAIFNMILAQPIDTPIKIAEMTDDESIFEPHLSQKSNAIDKRLCLKALDLETKKADLEEKIAYGAYFPNFSVRCEFIKEGDHPSVSGSEFHHADWWEVSALLDWRFWNWGKNRYKIMEQKSRKKQILHSRTLLANQIQLEINEAIFDIRHSEMKITALRKAAQLAAENLSTKQKLFQLQMITSSQVLDAQALLAQAQTDLSTVIYDHHIANARLLRALGRY